MTTNQNTKTCIHCKSEINKMASKCPHCGGKNYVWTFTKKLFLAFIIFMTFIIMSSSYIRSTVPAQESNTVTDINSAQVSKVFDINALYGKNIDQIITVLGKPYNNTEPTQLQKEIGTKEWDKTFKKDGYELIVTYNVSTREVIDLFIPTNDPSGLTQNVGLIKTIAGTPDTNKFTIKSVQNLKDPQFYTGVLFTPKK